MFVLSNESIQEFTYSREIERVFLSHPRLMNYLFKKYEITANTAAANKTNIMFLKIKI